MYEERLARAISGTRHDKAFAVVLPSGREARSGEGPPAFTIRFKTQDALRDSITQGAVGFGEAYVAGEVDIDGDVRNVVLLGVQLERGALSGGLVEKLRERLGFLARRNTQAGSRRNIAAHYDLGNEFYALWLDEAMQYTCAYFHDASDSLEQAQRQKMDLVCRKLRLEPGDLVVEAGCGWGGLALHMAREWGVRVKAFNISQEQVAFARERAQRMGVGTDRVEYVLDDYRNIPKYVERADKFASICMLEHVGKENYDGFRALMAGVLRPNGLALLQFISRQVPGRPHPWLEKSIFPGGYNPSLGEAASGFEARGQDLHVLDVENMRFHYALTLRHWRERLEAHADLVRERWGDDLVRAFRLYLAGCEVYFEKGVSTLVFQMLLANGFDNAAPMTRHHHYTWERAAARAVAAE